MTLRLTLLVGSPAKLAHGNAASRLALGLAQTGRVEPTMLCYSSDPAPSWLPPEIHVDRLGTDRVSRSLPPLIRYLRGKKPDVLVTRQMHANFFGLAASLAARTRHGWDGKLILVQDHPARLSHASNWRDNKWLAKLTYRFADGIISPSPVVREDIIRWCDLDPASVALVPNPIPPFTSPLGPPPHPWLEKDEPPVFVHTSNMTPWKRLDLLIDAFAELRRIHHVRLLIVGEGPGRSFAVERIRRLGLGAHAEAVGWVEDPLQFAARACAFVLPSDEEGFAQVLTEAMSVGCPVITTDAQGGGPRFVTDDGRCGILIPMGDTARLTDAMKCILRPDVRARYSALGRQRIESLSPVICADALIEFLAKRLGMEI
jgi:glycosyltransferase involved in cell wall biosynthesis